jgi:hypothetical protein
MALNIHALAGIVSCLTYEELDTLRGMVNDEVKRRAKIRAFTMPTPVIDPSLGRVRNTINYRDKYGCRLEEAQVVVDAAWKKSIDFGFGI